MIDYSLANIFLQIQSYPSLGMILLLVVLVVIISGATDAPNTVATAISTRCLDANAALVIAAIFNFLGLMVFTALSGEVVKTMFGMVDFSGDQNAALKALIAAMVASIGWGFFCWSRGIPASKSHSLIAGITGAALALNGIDGIVPEKWINVIWGFIFPLIIGLLLSFAITGLVTKLFSTFNRQKGNKFATAYQIFCSATLSFLHGGQDGQKFVSIALLGMTLSMGVSEVPAGGYPLWLMILCSVMMSVGTLIGGKRIIKKVAMEMVTLEKVQAATSSTSSIITLLVLTFAGIPCSTSQCSTAAIIGSAITKGTRRVKWESFIDMLKAWFLTFPCCGLIGFIIAKVLIAL